MSKKIFVLDTNVILSDPKAIFNFEENDIVIPLVVIEELDKFKKDMNQIGLAARAFARYIDSVRKRGSLLTGVQLKEGGTIRIDIASKMDLPNLDLGGPVSDNIILSSAYRVMKENPGTPVVLVTKDINMRIKADALGIQAETYKNETVNFSSLPKGFEPLDVPGDLI
ncbi:MAG: PIN domain-containing protein, partial [Rhodocyclaceae bacterium]|nr:PIN domain-containing protein [Rhodocyclaceae bacterium]